MNIIPMHITMGEDGRPRIVGHSIILGDIEAVIQTYDAFGFDVKNVEIELWINDRHRGDFKGLVNVFNRIAHLIDEKNRVCHLN